MRIAIIENDKVVNVIISNTIPINGIVSDIANINDDYINGEFIPPQVIVKPEIIITAISSNDADNIINGLSEITCKSGSTINVTAEIKKDGNIVTLTDSFKMPLIASDGRERIVLAKFVNGTANISSTLSEAGFWSITEEAINKGVAEENKFAFKGLQINTYI